jgi:hypothetical protein
MEEVDRDKHMQHAGNAKAMEQSIERAAWTKQTMPGLVADKKILSA